jgi:multiple antibiotic resistance protein
MEQFLSVLKSFGLPFLSIFLVMDCIGTMPIFLGITGNSTPKEKRSVLVQAAATAGMVGIGFVFFGKWVFHLVGITIADFRVAGGLLLLVFSIQDLLFEAATRRQSADLGVVPIGIPLIVGPAVLTGLLVSETQYGLVPTLLAFILNLVITIVVFLTGDRIVKLIGVGGAKGIGKVASLILAAIAVMLIRVGVEQMITGVPS